MTHLPLACTSSSPPRPSSSSHFPANTSSSNNSSSYDVVDGTMEEEYLLLLLSDSNLPTGGFVASSGLESFIQHGYLTTTTTTTTTITTTDGSNSNNEREKSLVEFIKMSLNNYQKLNEFIVEKSWKFVQDYKKQLNDYKGKSKEVIMDELLKIDLLCESMILNQISKRSSLAQGNALLSLYDRALSPPSPSAGNVIGELVQDIRKEIRKGVGLEGEGEGSGSRGWKGHQSTSFGIVMAAVGLSLKRCLHLFYFLHARSILSSAVRLNVIGPYSAHRLLLWDIKQLVERTTTITAYSPKEEESSTMCNEDVDDWWDNDKEWSFLQEAREEDEPVTTWPLGEIVASRHDQLFTKVFNS